MKNSFDWRKYVFAFIITAAIFGTAFYLAVKFNAARVADIRSMQNQMAVDLLSNETQYDLLGQVSCSDIAHNPILSDQLNDLASRLSYAEDNLGSTNDDVIMLKKQYSLLQIKDYLLMQKVASQCGINPVFVLYFYSNAGDCSDCAREGEVLTYLRETYPGLRVYSFDYNLDLSALRTLIGMRKIGSDMPALVINNRAPVYGFKSVDDIYKIAPEVQKLSTTTPQTATTTSAKRSSGL